ncbi:SPOR domain-containing protein [Phenylobacterium sp. LjRoot219]|uniref:cell division protein FtsN n=1 Tax=Phenylobacterium sp. LjRoot219 TaxID=3342283 RepID=UPI003ECC7030
MADHDRGAYAPPTADAPLSFDARQPVRGARPFPVTLIISGLVLVGLIVAIVLFYRSGVREAGQAPQTVGTPVAEMKSAAPADAQPQDPAAGLQIYQSEGGQAAPAGPNFVPPPEQPAARPEPQAPPPPAAAPTTPVGAGAALRPAAAPAAAPAAVAPVPPAPAPAPKAIQAPLPPPPAAKPAPTPAPAAAKAGAAAVQIGAVSSTALADKAWSKAVAAAPGLAVGKGKGVERIERDGKTLYRTSVTGFASKAEASAFCGKLKAAGTDCFVK